MLRDASSRSCSPLFLHVSIPSGVVEADEDKGQEDCSGLGSQDVLCSAV